MPTLISRDTPWGVKFLTVLSTGDDTWSPWLGGSHFIFGDAGNDKLTASIHGGDDALAGGPGNDTIYGLAGDDALFGDGDYDTLVGGAGWDHLEGGAQDDKLYSFRPNGPTLAIDTRADAVFDEGGFMDGGTGNDTLYIDVFFDGSLGAEGGEGTDTVDYSRTANAWRDGPPSTLPTNVLDLGSANGETPFGGIVTVARIEKIKGSEYRDEFYGDDNTNTLWGLSGNDVLEGRGDGDTIKGGAGHDAAQYTSAASGVTVDLAKSTQSLMRTTPDGDYTYNGDAASDKLSSIEELRGSDFDDIFRGRDSVGETLAGDAGDDILEGRDGGDTLKGSSGFDFASYESSNGRVEVFLPRPGFNSTNLNDAEGDTLISIEGLIGSKYGDSLIGNDERNELRGGDGADLLSGLGGRDVIDGGAGRDDISGAAGRDTMTGGSGADTFKFFSATDSNGTFGRRDVIKDFEADFDSFRVRGTIVDEKISLRAMDADQRSGAGGNQNFEFIGGDAFDAAGQVRVTEEVDADGRSYSLVRANVDGDFASEFQLSVYTTNDTLLGAGDFIL